MQEKKNSSFGKKSFNNQASIPPIWLIEVVSCSLVLAGIVLSFFYPNLGGALVGLGVGLSCYQEIGSIINSLKVYITEGRLLKVLIIIGLAAYLLVVIPAFILSLVIGFGILALLNSSYIKK